MRRDDQQENREPHPGRCPDWQHEQELLLRADQLAVQQHLAGWPTQAGPDAEALHAQKERALALGATR